MKNEVVSAVKIIETGELFLELKSNGEPHYQYIYRAAASVIWDADRHGFKSGNEPRQLTCADWILHIISSVKSELGVELRLDGNTVWEKLPKGTKAEVLG